jgi:hypothetical protein
MKVKFGAFPPIGSAVNTPVGADADAAAPPAEIQPVNAGKLKQSPSSYYYLDILYSFLITY